MSVTAASHAGRPQLIHCGGILALQFLLVDVDGDGLEGRCIQVDGAVIDRLVLRAREGR